MPASSARPRWIAIPLRVALLTALFTLLAFAVSLLLSIVGTAVYALASHAPANLGYAYRHIAFPFALTAGGIALVVFLVMEIRHYQVRKTLTEVERARG